jgi:hypothetical protein
MNPWLCAALIFFSGLVGGAINALLTDNGFIFPKRVKNIWCPGFISNILIGGLSAFISWACYGSGAGIQLAQGDRVRLGFTFSALAGALVVGVAGAKWLTNEADKKLLREGLKTVSQKQVSHEQCDRLRGQFDNAPARELLMAVEEV